MTHAYSGGICFVSIQNMLMSRQRLAAARVFVQRFDIRTCERKKSVRCS